MKLTRDELRRPDRVLALYQGARARGFAPPGVDGLLLWFCAARRALRPGVDDAGAVFVAICKARRWDLVSNDDEREAWRTVRAVVRWRGGHQVSPAANKPVEPFQAQIGALVSRHTRAFSGQEQI